MQFTKFATFFALLATLSMALSTLASPVLLTRDVIVPPVTSPKGGEVLHSGQTFTVTWDTSVVPPKSKNKGEIVLARPTKDSENLDFDHVLASGFLLTAGSQKVTIPHDIPSGDNYAFVLFGDSGNLSKLFKIVGY